MPSRCIAPLFVVALLAASCTRPTPKAAERPSVDLVVTNARIWTGDPELPDAEALAVSGETVVAVGTMEEIEPLVAPGVEVIDAKGAMVVPGFIDTHVHTRDGGEALASVQLRDAKTPEEFTQRIADYAAKLEPGQWILGGTWDHENWGGELPTRDWIDPVTPNNPVWVGRLDGHMALANSLALAAASIDRDTANIEGGEIVRDTGGRPTGVLKDNAMEPVMRAVPEPTAARRNLELDGAMAYYARNGVTTVHDMGTFESLAVFRRAHAAGRRVVRVHSFVPLAQWSRLVDDIAKHGRGDDWLRTGGLKGFMDGSLGSHTAAMLEPFTDTPGDKGFLINRLEDMRQWIGDADRAGLHVAVHAIGDSAIRDLLDIYAEVAEANGPRDRRFRMEHAQHIHPSDLGRFETQGVIASMQPYHAIDDGRWAERIIGAERAKTTYAFRSLIDSGARLAFGSDWPVAPATPIEGIYAAVTRQTLDGAHSEGWVPEQKVTVEHALRAYTLAGAHAAYEESKKGMLRKDMLADFVILGRDLRAIPPKQIRDVSVLRTIVGGRTVYWNDTAR